MLMLQKIRARRAKRTKAASAGKQQTPPPSSATGKKNDNAKTIFRSKNHSSGLPRFASQLAMIPPAVTFTISEEEDESVASTSNLHKNEVLRQQEVAHMEEICMRENELSKMKLIMDELRELHAEAIADKDDEIAYTTAAFQQSEKERANVLAEIELKNELLEKSELELVETRLELEDTKVELVATKDKLGVVCHHLMQNQYELHETQEQLDAVTSLANLGKGIAGLFSF